MNFIRIVAFALGFVCFAAGFQAALYLGPVRTVYTSVDPTWEPPTKYAQCKALSEVIVFLDDELSTVVMMECPNGEQVAVDKDSKQPIVRPTPQPQRQVL